MAQQRKKGARRPSADREARRKAREAVRDAALELRRTQVAFRNADAELAAPGDMTPAQAEERARAYVEARAEHQAAIAAVEKAAKKADG